MPVRHVPPCPSVVLERAALIEEGEGLERTAADAQALAEYGFASWADLAAAIANVITAELDRLPAPFEETGVRLLEGTRRFISGPHWLDCIASGWLLVDMFGADEWTPFRRPLTLGLVPRAALAPAAGRRLVGITADGASFQDRDGTRTTFRRPSFEHLAHGDLVVWWHSRGLVSEEAA